jgi:hypothetical protein
LLEFRGGPPYTIQGTLSSGTSALPYELEFFSNPECDDTGYGEGAIFQPVTTTATVLTDGQGNATFFFTFENDIPPDHFITATATDGLGNTSEFSACLGKIPGLNTVPARRR